MNWDYLKQKQRIQEEVIKSISDAEGSLDSFNIAAVVEFVYAAQCNNIEIFRDGMYGAYHIKYVPFRELDEKGLAK